MNQPSDYHHLQNAHEITGAAVVIDVCRAFTTAAYAFAAGAQRILLVGEVQQALDLHEQLPGSLIMGEMDGLPIPGFHLWNSPSQIRELYHSTGLTGKTLIQRTSAGTQGMVRAVQAQAVLACSFAVAGATARYLTRQPLPVRYVITGYHNDNHGVEDAACADYISALLRMEQPNPADYLHWVTQPHGDMPDAPWPSNLKAIYEADLELCKQVDAFDFVMIASRQPSTGLLELIPHPVK